MSGGEFSGALDQMVRVERWVSGSDDLGGDAGGWVAEGRRWAGIRTESAKAGGDGDALSTRQRFRVMMRQNAALGVQHRLIWQDRVLTILSIIRDPAEPDRLRLLVEERQ